MGGAVMWVRIDDDFANHPKVLRVAPLARWLHVVALCYCARQLTDGFVPAEAVSTLFNWSPAPTRTKRAALVDALVNANLWERVEDGYRIHDFLEYNPSREKVLAAVSRGRTPYPRRR